MPVKVSIVVPIYNVKKYFEQCVESIMLQPEIDIEVILVDDGSTDLSSELCEKYTKWNSRIIVIHKENEGLTSSRKTGIFAASGDYVMIVDGDDWIEKNTISTLTKRLQLDDELDLVIFSHQKEYPDNSYPRHLFDKDTLFDGEMMVRQCIFRRLFGLSNSELIHPLDMDYLSTCWGKLYRRELVLRAKFINTSEVGSGEDGVFNMYALDSCKKALYIDQPFYHYRYTTGSLTLKYRPNLSNQWRNLFALMQEKIDINCLSSDFQEALNNRIALSVLGIGMNEIDNPNGSFFQFAGYMKRYISSGDYRTAIKTMKLGKLPLPWKMLMLCCKCRFGFGTALILKIIRMIKNRL